MLSALGAQLATPDSTRRSTRSWQNINMALEKRAAPLYQDAFPCKFKSMPLVNAGPIMAACMKLFKLFIKKKLADRMVVCRDQEELYTTLGYSRAGMPERLGGTFTGDYEASMREALARRAASIQSFTLG
jgi:hypothetical protein